MRPNWRCWLCAPLLAFSASATAASSHQETFNEQLILKQYRDGKVLSRFTFNTLLQDAVPRRPATLSSDDASQHYTLFPLALGQILHEYAVTELHLTLNAGKWNYDRWGLPEEVGVSPGAELWAWIGDGAEQSVDERWTGLRNALAGLFCASLGSLDAQRTTSPSTSFPPEGDLPDWGGPHYIRHASLPSEHVCTENLTPFLKLLPCKSLSGIASLLNPHRLFDADWHGMGIHVLWQQERGIEVRLTFQSVSDPVRTSVGRKQDWSFRSLFDRVIERNCPIAQSSRVDVTLPVAGAYNLLPEPTRVEPDTALFDVGALEKPLDISLHRRDDFHYSPDFDASISPISFLRSLQGSSQARGHLSLTVRNHLNAPLSIQYLETMPWLVQFYLHSLRLEVNGLPKDDAISNLTYIPAVPHTSPATFQCTLTLPPGGTLHLKMDAAKSFLRYTEHPPDAQRGWDLPPAILTPLGRAGNSSFGDYHGKRIYTPALLVDLATPDFSMPYNVIIFTCSLVAFLFGSVFNLLTRKFVVVNLDNSQRAAN